MDRRKFLVRAGIAGAVHATFRDSAFAQTLLRMQIFDVTAFGAKGDGRTLNTFAIQAAIDACARNGGGTVLIPPGTFVSGTIVLKPHVTLHINGGATLRASDNRDDFRRLGSLIFADHADNIAISGTGTIDGNFHAFLKERDAGGYRVIQPFLGPYDPLYDIPGRDHPDGRPRMILLVGCIGAHLVDFTMRGSPTWTIHPIGCENLSISRLTIRNDLAVPNCDGIDIDHCKNVHISDCDIQAGDDCIVLKASRNFRQYGTCENIVVSNCVLTSSSAGVKVEAEGLDTVRMAVVSDCSIADSNRGICVMNRDGALLENLIFSNLVISTKLQPSMWWGAAEPVHVSNIPRTKEMQPGTIRDVQFNNIVCCGESGIYVHGWPGNPVDVAFSNINLVIEKTSPIPGGFYDLRPGDVAGGIYQHSIAGVQCENVRRLDLHDVSVEWRGAVPAYYGPALEAHHIQQLSLRDFRGANAHPGKTQDRIMEDVTVSIEASNQTASSL